MDLVEVEDLRVEFPTDAGPLRAVDGISLAVPRGSTLGLVGESGSGKSVTAMSLIGLLPRAARVSGSIRFDGTEVTTLPAARLRELRGGRIGVVFQDPGAALDPFHRVGDQIAEAIVAHAVPSRASASGVPRGAARPLRGAELDARVIALLRDVGIPAPEERRHAYPHQLSGGMRQRVMIAIALSCDPQLLIADEPTTALDVTVQAQVIELLKSVQRARGMSVLLITHDLGLVAEACSRVAVMYAGTVVEQGPTAEVLASPKHPYTAGLLASTPRGDGSQRLREIPGVVPDLRTLAPGCRFADRCTYVGDPCRVSEPPLVSIGATRSHRCLFPLGSAT